jgi:branched-subunit amino acid transport protein
MSSAMISAISFVPVPMGTVLAALIVSQVFNQAKSPRPVLL